MPDVPPVMITTLSFKPVTIVRLLLVVEDEGCLAGVDHEHGQ
jgi:hypothetical protein